MGSIIPGLNYDSKLSVDDLSFMDEQFEIAILDRFKAVFGSDSLVYPEYGVIDAMDPKNLVGTETTRPLIVYASSSNPLNVDIAAGSAICPNGAIVRNLTLVEDFELARTSANDIVVVFLENEIVDSKPIRITRYNVSQPVRRTQSTAIVRSVLLNDYNNAVTFTPKRKAGLVVIAVVVVASTVIGLELQIDYSASTYIFNRPWFSTVDVKHRSKLGSGSATDRNPHGTSFNDLVSGSLTLYDQFLKHGIIIAKDNDIKGTPGKLCSESVTTSRVLTDTGGAITAGSRFGGVGAKYVVLASYPVGVTSFYLSSHKGRAVAFDLIPGTRIIVLPAPEALTGTATIQYNQVFAGMPPASLLSNTLTFTQPNSTNELVISGGLSLSVFNNPAIDFDGSGPVPRNYRIYLKGDGTILRSPQLIQTTTRLDDIGVILTPISFSIFGPAKLSIGLADANPAVTMSVVIRLYGKDAQGTAIQEDVTFSGATWTNVTLPGTETLTQFKKTSQTFYSITNIQVQSRTDDGPNSKVILWAELETEITSGLNKLALLATLSWDGTAIRDLKDVRQIVTDLPALSHRFRSAAEMVGLGGTVKEIVLSEDFHNARYRDSTKDTQAPVQATFSIFIGDFTLIQAGDQVLFPTSILITAVTSGVPNRTIGEYLASSSDSDTRDDMVLTINNVPLNSGITALADDSDNKKLNCTVVQTGARGNGSVTEPIQANPTAITLGGNAVGGIDGFGETHTPRHQPFILSSIPSPSTYEVYTVRERYLSIPIPISASKKNITVIVHEVDVPRAGGVQVRMRVASSSDPTWLPWEVLTADGAVFSLSKTYNISKVQIEIFGKCSGFSLYEAV